MGNGRVARVVRDRRGDGDGSSEEMSMTYKTANKSATNYMKYISTYSVVRDLRRA